MSREDHLFLGTPDTPLHSVLSSTVGSVEGRGGRPLLSSEALGVTVVFHTRHERDHGALGGSEGGGGSTEDPRDPRGVVRKVRQRKRRGETPRGLRGVVFRRKKSTFQGSERGLTGGERTRERRRDGDEWT